MKSQIATIISILIFSSLASAAACTAENLAGVWTSQSLAPDQVINHCGRTKKTETTRFYFYSKDGQFSGHGSFSAYTTFTNSQNCAPIEVRQTYQNNELVGGLLVTSDSTFSCDITADGSELTLNGKAYTRTAGSQAMNTSGSAPKTRAVAEVKTERAVVDTDTQYQYNTDVQLNFPKAVKKPSSEVTDWVPGYL